MTDRLTARLDPAHPGPVDLPAHLDAVPSRVEPGETFTFDAAQGDAVAASPLFDDPRRADSGDPAEDDPDPSPGEDDDTERTDQ